MAGQPGAGKSVLSQYFFTRFQQDAFSINGDDYRRFHPAYRELIRQAGSDYVRWTGPFSGAVTEALIETLSLSQYNLIIEGTGRTAEVPKKTAALLVSRGYTVELAAIAVRPEQSLASTLLRFYQMRDRGTVPRATVVASHDLVVKALPNTLDVLVQDPHFSRITLWDRQKDCLYDSTSDQCMPSEALRRVWNGPWTSSDLQAMERQIQFLRQKEEQAPTDQMAAIEELERRVQRARNECIE